MITVSHLWLVVLFSALICGFCVFQTVRAVRSGRRKLFLALSAPVGGIFEPPPDRSKFGGGSLSNAYSILAEKVSWALRSKNPSLHQIVAGDRLGAKLAHSEDLVESAIGEYLKIAQGYVVETK